MTASIRHFVIGVFINRSRFKRKNICLKKKLCGVEAGSRFRFSVLPN